MDPMIASILSLDRGIRYVAVLRDGQLTMEQRPGISGPSAAESDRYEELLVNPVLLGLTGARGDLDCGGREYVIIRYGRFFQVLFPLPVGHVSISVDPDTNPIHLLAAIKERLQAAQS